MKTIGVIWAASISLFAAGEVVDAPFAWIANLTGLSGCLLTLWWMLTHTIPAQQKAFHETLDKMADRWDAREGKRDEATKELSAAITALTTNCAAVNGQRRET